MLHQPGVHRADLDAANRSVASLEHDLDLAPSRGPEESLTLRVYLTIAQI
jgi:hypothetical protein